MHKFKVNVLSKGFRPEHYSQSKSMKKIKKRLKNNGYSFKKFILPVMVVVGGIGLSVQQYLSSAQQAEATLAARFNIVFNEATLQIIEKVEAYQQMLRATQGFFYGSGSVTRQEFRTFTQELELESNYEGLLGLGYVPLIQPGKKAEHTDRIRRSGFPDYRIYPEGDRKFFTSILYLEPFSDRNLRAFGYDMSSEPNRREAMLRARDLHHVALSAGVKLVQDLADETTTGLLMYLPLFENPGSGTLETGKVEGNKHHGWVYVVFRIDDVVNSSLDVNSNIEHFRIRDITGTEPQTLYQSEIAFDDHPVQSEPINVGGRLWQFESVPGEQFIADYRQQPPVIGLFLGMLFFTALAYILWLTSSGRIRAENIARRMTRRLREQNQRLSLATEAADMGVWDWDFSTDQVLLNRHMATVMGLSRADNPRVPFTVWLDAIKSNDHPRLQRAIDEAVKQRVELNIRVMADPEKSPSRMLQLNAVVRFDNEGQPVGMLGVSFDITETWLHHQQLKETEARWKHALEGSGEGVWDWSIPDERVVFSEKLITMLGFQPEEFQPHLSEWASRVHPDDRQQVEKDLQAMLKGDEPFYSNEHRLLCKDGSWKWILDRGTVIENDENGKPLRAVGTHSDISQRKAIEINLRQSEERFRNAFDTAPIGMALVGVDGRFLEVNEALCEMLGYEESELLDLTFGDITHPDDLEPDLGYVDQLIKGEIDHYQMEKRYFQKSGQIVEALLSVSVVHDHEGQVMHFVSQIEDITARKREEARLNKLAFRDALTGLPNRRLFDERITHEIESARRNKQQMALMFIDIDHFKRINDSYGHDVGDDVIKKVADEMRGVLRASDTLARLGGDEFVVMLNDLPDAEAAIKVAENLRKPFAGLLRFASCEIQITLSIGVAIWTPEKNNSVTSLMKRADVALYQVKANGRNGVEIYQTTHQEKQSI